MVFKKTPSYLWQHASGLWFLKRPIPPELRHHFVNPKTGKPRTHVVESLGTHSRSDAERLKRPSLRSVEAQFARLSSPLQTAAAGRHHQRLMDIRHSMATAIALEEARVKTEDDEWEDPHGVSILEDMAFDAANEMAKEQGSQASRLAYGLAVQPGRSSLKEALTDRHKGAKLREQTKGAEVKALADLLAFLQVPDALPEAVTEKQAQDYVESLNDGKLSHATKKGRLSCLGRLWATKRVRGQLARGAANLWRGHDVKGEQKSTDEPEEEAGRVWTVPEMVKVFSAPALVDKRRRVYTRPLFRELHALGFTTGMRLDEITSLRPLDLSTIEGGGVVVTVRKAKSNAGRRVVPVVHPTAVAILSQRKEAQADPGGLLFSECASGGPDSKTSWHVSKAMGRDRDRLGLNEVTFHSTRGTFMTLQENAGTNVVHVQRYVGHVIDTVMHKRYSAGSTPETLLLIAEAVKYADEVEAQLAIIGSNSESRRALGQWATSR